MTTTGTSTADVPPQRLRFGDGWPEIRQRVGLDLDPIDVHDQEARRWLEAFVWPEQVEELRRLRAAIDHARSTPGVELIQADAVTEAASVLSRVSGSEPLIIFTASLLSYLTHEQTQAFLAQLATVADHRRIAWLFAENPGLLARAGIEAEGLTGPLGKDPSVYAVGTRFAGPDNDQGDALLAVADPYLTWLKLI